MERHFGYPALRAHLLRLTRGLRELTDLLAVVRARESSIKAPVEADVAAVCIWSSATER